MSAEFFPLLAQSSSVTWTFAILSIVLGGLIHGLLGLGFPLVATPLLAMITDVRSAVLIALVPNIGVNVGTLWAAGRWQRQIRTHWPLAAYAVLGSVAGTQLLVVTDPAPYRLLLAAAIGLYLNMHRWGLRLTWLQQHPRLAMALFGIVAGLLAGTVNVMLPALVIFALEMNLGPKTMVPLFNFCFLIGKLSQMATFAAAGVFTGDHLVAALPLALLAVAALLVGVAFRQRIDTDRYRRWMRVLLAVIAVLLAGQFVVGL